MQEAVAQIRINEYELKPDDIAAFQFVCDIDDGYPKGILTLNDKSGEILSRFEGLEIGSKVQFVAVDRVKNTEDKNPAIAFCELMVASVAEIPSDTQTIHGNIELLLVHPWEFFKDYSNHAYNGLQNSQIIKNILESDARGFKFKDMFISSSDDDGKQPRYKCCESDYEFIKNKLLPYTTIGGAAAMFWIDELSRPHLQGVEKAFTQEPKALIVNMGQDIGHDEKVQEALKTIKNVMTYSNIKVKVGDEDISSVLAPLQSKVYVDFNTVNGGIFLGRNICKMKVGKSGGPQVKSVLPVDLITGSGDKGILALSNRSRKDQDFFIGNITAPLLNMFRLEVFGNFVGESVHVGDIVQVYIPAKPDLDDDKKPKSHWLSGPWLVKKSSTTMRKENDFKVNSNLVLVRPTFVVNTKESNIPSLKYYKGL